MFLSIDNTVILYVLTYVTNYYLIYMYINIVEEQGTFIRLTLLNDWGVLEA